MKIISKTKVPFGVGDILPLKGFAEGKIRIKMRNKEFVRVYVKTANGITEWVPKVEDGYWMPGYKQGQNQRQ